MDYIMYKQAILGGAFSTSGDRSPNKDLPLENPDTGATRIAQPSDYGTYKTFQSRDGMVSGWEAKRGDSENSYYVMHDFNKQFPGTEQARRFQAIPERRQYGYRIFGQGNTAIANSEMWTADTANQWHHYLRQYERDHNGQLPLYAKKNENGQYYVDYAKVPPDTQTNPQPSSAQSATSSQPKSVIPSDLLNNDAVKRIKDPEQMRKYLEIMLPVAGGMQQFVSGGDFSVDAVLTNDVAIDGFSKALENADPQALKIIQQMQQELAAKKSTSGSSTKAGIDTSSSDPNTAQRDANIKKLTDSAAKGVWNSIKADPIKNLPIAMSMFLKHIGVGDGIADFFENPFAFYGSVLALLLGGGALIGGFGGGSSNQPTIVNNYYGQQQPKGYNIVPYT